MRDCIGNRLTEGSLVEWHIPRELYHVLARIVRVTEPVLEHDASAPPVLTIAIDIPIGGTKPGTEAQLGDFVCVVNPQAEAAIEKVMEMTKGKRPQ